MVGLVNASILAADMADLSGEVRRAVEAGADWIHVDVVDNHFAKVRALGWFGVDVLFFCLLVLSLVSLGCFGVTDCLHLLVFVGVDVVVVAAAAYAVAVVDVLGGGNCRCWRSFAVWSLRFMTR